MKKGLYRTIELSVLLSTLLFGCRQSEAKTESVSEERKFNVTRFSITPTYSHVKDEDGVDRMVLSYDNGFFADSCHIRIDNTDIIPIAGDCLYVRHHGEILAQATSPMQYVPGEGYEFVLAYIEATPEICRYQLTEENTKEAFRKQFDLQDDHVILTERGTYTSLEDFTGDAFYYTIDYRKCWRDTLYPNTEPRMKPVAGLYAYNPRPQQ